jgi:hypothetical protein
MLWGWQMLENSASRDKQQRQTAETNSRDKQQKVDMIVMDLP